MDYVRTRKFVTTPGLICQIYTLGLKWRATKYQLLHLLPDRVFSEVLSACHLLLWSFSASDPVMRPNERVRCLPVGVLHCTNNKLVAKIDAAVQCVVEFSIVMIHNHSYTKREVSSFIASDCWVLVPSRSCTNESWICVKLPPFLVSRFPLNTW